MYICIYLYIYIYAIFIFPFELFSIFCYCQEIAGRSCTREDKQRQFMIADCHTDREDCWTEGDSGHSQDVSGKFNSFYIIYSIPYKYVHT